MTLKKVKIINVLFLFVLSFLIHFIYKIIPNPITAIFFPVNESIWEHMKILYSALIIGSIFGYILCKRYDIKINNVFIEILTKSTLSIIFYLIIFIPIYKLFGESMTFSLILMFITYVVMEVIGFFILKSEELNIKLLPILILLLGYIIFGVLTVYPRHNFLFYDYENLGYGILK